MAKEFSAVFEALGTICSLQRARPSLLQTHISPLSCSTHIYLQAEAAPPLPAPVGAGSPRTAPPCEAISDLSWGYFLSVTWPSEFCLSDERFFQFGARDS